MQSCLHYITRHMSMSNSEWQSLPRQTKRMFLPNAEKEAQREYIKMVREKRRIARAEQLNLKSNSAMSQMPQDETKNLSNEAQTSCEASKTINTDYKTQEPNLNEEFVSPELQHSIFNEISSSEISSNKISPNKISPNKILPNKISPTFKIPNNLEQNSNSTAPYQIKKRSDFRINKMGIQMLSSFLYKQVFQGYPKTKENHNLLQKCLDKLTEYGMVTKESSYLKDVNFEIPALKGANIEEHFYNLGEEQSKPYRDLVLQLLQGIPEKPTEWVMKEGWTKYEPNCDPVRVDCPEEEALIFDVEVCVQAGQAPTLATAVSPKAWYGWVSKALIDGSSKPVTNHMYVEDILIPLETKSEENKSKRRSNNQANILNHLKKPKIVIGHNVSYDRARIKEQYHLQSTGLRFLDTMSLHICISGLTSYQRAMMKSKTEDEELNTWKQFSSLNNLNDVHNLYCGSPIEKETRNLFVEGHLYDIKCSFQDVMNYCSNDVVATHNILKKMFPVFLERFPHPVTLAGMLEIGMAYLPVNGSWQRYIESSEQTYEDLDLESRLLLARRADQACHLMHNDKYKEDIWMWDQDWDTKEIKFKKTKSKKLLPIKPSKSKTPKLLAELKSEEIKFQEIISEEGEFDPRFKMLEDKFKYLNDMGEELLAKSPLLPGYPNWYRKLCSKPNSDSNWIPSPHLISTSMQVTPKLLSLTWEGYPLHYIQGLGWGLLVPFSSDLNIETKLPLKSLLEKCPAVNIKSGGSNFDMNLSKEVEQHLSKKDFYSRVPKQKVESYGGSGVWTNTILEDCCYFFKLPHKNGNSYRVGNPLAKDFLNKFSENVLSGDTESAERVLCIARQLSYWRNNRDRIYQQMVVWLDPNKMYRKIKQTKEIDYKIGAIIPQVVVCGTLTRRAVEPTWMTASNAHPERIGSELRSMVQAPPGYNIVGADVDSQELWIASVLGDAHHAKMHGCTPLGWMTLTGTKADATDMHSVTAKTVGISRDHAKVINYARIYGAGQRFAERLLKQFNPTISEGEARSKAIKMFSFTKGKQIYRPKHEFLGVLEDKFYNKWDAFELAKAYNKVIGEMFEKPRWIGGTESAMFNRLEEIADLPEPVTPFLNCRLSRALEPQNVNRDEFLPTRVNWVVQSGAVDFLHLMLVSMRWLLGDKARFVLSFHDEVRYLVKEEYKYEACFAMHVTNLLTRAFCCARIGLYDLPQSVAFFSSVEVDTAMRKDAKQNCVTPSNPHGLENGYGLPAGESLDIYETLEKIKVDLKV